jgi:hypothetical protein
LPAAASVGYQPTAELHYPQAIPSATTNAAAPLLACTGTEAAVTMSAKKNTTGSSSGSAAVIAGECIVIELAAGTMRRPTSIVCGAEFSARP